MDKQEETNEEYYAYLQTEKWRNIADTRAAIDKGICQGCGSRGNSMNPLQVHHLNYYHIYEEEGREYSDLVLVCRSCHAVLHNVMNRITSPDGKRGWKMNPHVPTVNTLTLSGLDLQARKENFKQNES